MSPQRIFFLWRYVDEAEAVFYRADRSVVAGCLVKKIPRPAIMNEVIAYVVSSHGYSKRRASLVMTRHRSTQRKPSMRDPRAAVQQRMHEIVAMRIRYG